MGGVAIVLLVVFAVSAAFAALVIWRNRDPAPGFQRVTLNYLILDESDAPLTPKEVCVAGINHVGLVGEHHQKIIATLRPGEPIYLIRMPDNPHDTNAIALFRANGQDIGYLPREWAEEIAPRLDAGSPVTATVKAVEPFDTEMGRHLLGVRLLMVPHRLKRQSVRGRGE